MIDKPFFFLTDFQNYGGDTTMTAHIFHALGIAKSKLVLMATANKKLEEQPTPFGYGLLRQRVPIEVISECRDIFIMQLENQSYYEMERKGINLFNRDDITFVIHLDTLIKDNLLFYENIKRMFRGHNHQWKLITIRKSLQKILFQRDGIISKYIPHIWFDFPVNENNQKYVNDLSKKSGAVVLSRISATKKIHWVFDANDVIEKMNDGTKTIDVYGMRYQGRGYSILLTTERMHKYWRGRVDKDFGKVSDILSKKKFLVNLSNFPNDGGGTEYSTMEGIYHNCAVILNRNWLEKPKQMGIKSDFQEGYNCLAVSSYDELAYLIRKNPDTDSIVKNAREILKKHSSPEVVSQWKEALAS